MRDKLNHLLESVDLTRPDMAAVTTAADPAGALLAALVVDRRPRYRFEHNRKQAILAFLREHYPAWKKFDPSEADGLAAMSVEDARRPRATWGLGALGKAWWATGDPRYGSAFESFYLDTPTGSMFNEVNQLGMQAVSELEAFFLLLDCPGFSTAGRIGFLDHIYQVATETWDKHLSGWDQLLLGPEGHNWYTGGSAALVHVGLLFPGFKRAEFFARTGCSFIEDHLRGHIKVDGGFRESFLGYAPGGVIGIWDQWLIAERNGAPLSPQSSSQILCVAKYLLRLASPTATIPVFGDTRPFPGILARVAALSAALSGDEECKWYAEHFRGLCPSAGHDPYGPFHVPSEAPGQVPEEVFWRVGLEGADRYARTRSRDPGHTSVLMPASGYVAMRDSDRSDAAFMAVAAAERGPVVTSHSHNDIFAIEVHAGGARLLGALGAALYGNHPARDYDVRTEAHNCFTIEGQEQVPIVTEWRWAKQVFPAIRRWISQPTHDFFDAVHEGFYSPGVSDTLHRRKVLFLKAHGPVKKSYWVVMDWVISQQEHAYRAYFHGAVPGKLDGLNVVLGRENQPRLAILPPAGEQISVEAIHSPGRLAYLEQHSRNVHPRTVTPDDYPCFAYGRRSRSDCFVWAIVPLEPGEAMPRVERLPARLNELPAEAHEASAVRISFDDHHDDLCISHKDFDADIEFGGHKAWGFLAFRRIVGGEKTLSFGGTMADGVCGR